MRRCGLILILAAVMTARPLAAAEAGLVILTETGQVRDGLPVFSLHPDPDPILRVLSRGFSGRMLRLYQLEQEYLRRATGSRAEPAYLLLSGTQGGFPRFGFFLGNQDKRGVGYVDLHRSSRLAGRFGAMDQIFPHELAHIMVRQLAGAPQSGGSNQLHATGLRTDPSQAFQEGFAEHLQVMAVDDPDADPSTRALIHDERIRAAADRQARNYRRDLEARWPVPGPSRMSFMLWFSGTEQAWRYFAVKENAFARADPLPERMLAARDLYPAYLLQNALPGSLQGAPKPVSVMLSTEGVVSTLLYRWASSDALRKQYRDEAFYQRFGAQSADISPVENVYLKIFHVLHTRRPADAAALVRGYEVVFPDEYRALGPIVQETLLGHPLQTAPELWLANQDFQTGSSLFDQFRSMPRIHTFDLNAATLVDLLGIPGMTRSLADRVLENAPYAKTDELQRIAEMSPDLMARFFAMTEEMEQIRSGAQDAESGINLGALLQSYVWRALGILAIAAVGALLLYRCVRACGIFRAAVNGLGASLLVLALAWLTTGTAAPIALAGPTVVFGVPASFWQLLRRRGAGQAVRSLLAWAAAALPATVVAYPWI